MKTNDDLISTVNTGRFVLDVEEHWVLDADSAFYNFTGYRGGARFEEIFEKQERAAVQQRLSEQVEEGVSGSLTASLRSSADKRKPVCVVFEYRRMLSGTLRLHGVIAQLELPKPDAQSVQADEFTMRELKKGIENNEFCLTIQPIFNLRTGKVAGGEILTRWIKNGEEILPDEFFSQLEDAQIGCELDFHVLTTAMPLISELSKRRGAGIPVSVNLSEQHFKNGGFAERIEALAEGLGVDKHFILFELKAEQLETQDPEVHRQVNDLREAGFRIVVDGIKGDSRSLLALESGVVDCAKLERTFIARCIDTDFGRDLLRLLLNTMEKLKIEMICTGVETDAQRSFLKKCGCLFAQGYLFARPMPLEEFVHHATDW